MEILTQLGLATPVAILSILIVRGVVFILDLFKLRG